MRFMSNGKPGSFRSIAGALALGLVAASSAGCATESNGADGNFHFEAPGPGAVGEIVPVWVRRAGSLCGDRASITDGFCLPVDAQIEQVLSAECTDPTMCQVESVTERVQQIARAVNEQKRGSEIIMRSVEDGRNISRQSVKVVTEMNKMVEELAKQAEHLKQSIGRFKVKL